MSTLVAVCGKSGWWAGVVGWAPRAVRRCYATELTRADSPARGGPRNDAVTRVARSAQPALRAEAAPAEKPRGNVPFYGANATRQPVPLSASTVTWDAPRQPENATVVRVALAGLPNAGKSSLMNALLGAPLAAVSPKVNTTREDIKGVLCVGSCQMVFTDCPGLLESHRRRRFCAPLVDTAWRAYQEADVCLFVLDTVKRPDAGLFRVIRALAGSAPCEAHGGAEGSAGLGNGATNWGCHGQQTEGATTDGHLVAVGGEEGYEDGEESPEPRKPVALVLNKIDLVQHKKWVKSRTRELKNHGTFAGVFYTSAKHGIGVENIVQFLKAAARPGHWVYPPDMLTTMSQVQVVEQAVRTYIYCWFNRELPYQVGQKVIGWTRAENGALIIEMELYVRTDGAAKIICGVQGRIVKQMQKNVSHRLSKMWKEPVFLYIQVKVKPTF